MCEFLSEVISILSGKGGTGKTALCAGIATALASSGRRVLCIDMDVGLRNLDIFLGLNGVEVLSFLDLCSGNYPMSAISRLTQYPNLYFLTAPVNCTAEDIDTAEFGAFLTRAREKFDFILLDGPAGIGPGMVLAAQFADRCIVCTLPDPASLRSAGRTGEELEKMDCGNVRLVVNRVFSDLMKTMKMDIDDVMDTVGLPLLGVVPSDPNVSFAAAAGKPIDKYSRFGAAAAYKRIAKRILGLPVPISNR